MNRHVGELPGARALDSGMMSKWRYRMTRMNDFTLGAEWTNTRNMLNVAYTDRGSTTWTRH
jgi:hypothetical protein